MPKNIVMMLVILKSVSTHALARSHIITIFLCIVHYFHEVLKAPRFRTMDRPILSPRYDLSAVHNLYPRTDYVSMFTVTLTCSWTYSIIIANTNIS